MLKRILKIEGTSQLNNKDLQEINGGFGPFPQSADCRDYHQGNCPSFCRPEECDPFTPCIH